MDGISWKALELFVGRKLSETEPLFEATKDIKPSEKITIKLSALGKYPFRMV